MNKIMILSWVLIGLSVSRWTGSLLPLAFIAMGLFLGRVTALYRRSRYVGGRVPTRMYEVPDDAPEVGVDLGVLPQLHGDWLSEDLQTALCWLPIGVTVRVQIGDPTGTRFVVEGSITGYRDSDVIVGRCAIGPEDRITGLVVLADPRTVTDASGKRADLAQASPATPPPGQPEAAEPVPEDTTGQVAGQPSGASAGQSETDAGPAPDDAEASASGQSEASTWGQSEASEPTDGTSAKTTDLSPRIPFPRN